jgi:Uma2 family endonuclease
VIELKSESDSLKELKKKMQLWMANGCRLAWLIDAQDQTTYIYRPNQQTETMVGFNSALSGEAELPGFELDLKELIA